MTVKKLEIEMGLHKDFDDSQSFPDVNYQEDREDLPHRKQVRRMLEDKLERRRLKEELDDELEGEFNWDDFDR